MTTAHRKVSSSFPDGRMGPVISRAFPLCADDGAGTDEMQGCIHRNRVRNGVLVPALPMPPDPSTVAAKVDSTVAATIGGGTAFLYIWP